MAYNHYCVKHRRGGVFRLRVEAKGGDLPGGRCSPLRLSLCDLQSLCLERHWGCPVGCALRHPALGVQVIVLQGENRDRPFSPRRSASICPTEQSGRAQATSPTATTKPADGGSWTNCEAGLFCERDPRGSCVWCHQNSWDTIMSQECSSTQFSRRRISNSTRASLKACHTGAQSIELGRVCQSLMARKALPSQSSRTSFRRQILNYSHRVHALPPALVPGTRHIARHVLR